MPNVSVDPSRLLCNPDPAPADPAAATIFTFSLVNPNLWDWRGTSPVDVPGGGDGQFPPSYVDPRTNRVVLFDRNTIAGQYKYTVAVTNKSTGAPVTIDPFIQNQ